MNNRTAFVIIGILILTSQLSFAGSATWSSNPTSNDWDTAANWVPNTVPNGPTDVATFAASSITSLKFSAVSTEVAEIVFNPGASSFNINADAQLSHHHATTLTISGVGITNNSGVTQNLTSGPTVHGDLGIIEFLNSATAGDGTAVTALGSVSEGAFPGSEINFYDTSTAGTASIRAEGATGTLNAYGGRVSFNDSATAANANFTATGAVVGGSYGGTIYFFDSSTAGNAIFTIEGPSNGGFFGGEVVFFDNSEAETAQLMVFSGGTLGFSGGDGGGQARIELFGGRFGSGTLDLTFLDSMELTVGSIEGEDGTIRLGDLFGPHKLITGGNNLSTIFSGTIQEDGSLEKIGTGTLTLSGKNSYNDGTTISSGILLVSNSSGSGTGTGQVSVNAGTLGGSGIISGSVTVGTNTGVQAFLAPSKGVKKSATLTIQGNLTLDDDSTYIYKLDTKRPASDEVIANGVVIDSGAKFSLRPSGHNALTSGQVFTVISNTSASPIVGTFHNLADGAIVNVNGSNLQANYEGGDGNDLTLTVVP